MATISTAMTLDLWPRCMPWESAAEYGADEVIETRGRVPRAADFFIGK